MVPDLLSANCCIAAAPSCTRYSILNAGKGCISRHESRYASLLHAASPSVLPDVQDKLLISTLGQLAQRRLARGLILNRSEAVALIASQLHEYIRDGRHSVAQLMDLGKKMLGRRHVMGELAQWSLRSKLRMAEGVEEGIHDIQVEGTFPVSAFVLRPG